MQSAEKYSNKETEHRNRWACFLTTISPWTWWAVLLLVCHLEVIPFINRWQKFLWIYRYEWAQWHQLLIIYEHYMCELTRFDRGNCVKVTNPCRKNIKDTKQDLVESNRPLLSQRRFDWSYGYSTWIIGWHIAIWTKWPSWYSRYCKLIFMNATV